ncbi:MAG: hypothetical protein IJ112_04555 [Oscillospiraceae bacterium]|nr:hypothetical protein [Oscillospiraceae bacterium]
MIFKVKRVTRILYFTMDRGGKQGRNCEQYQTVSMRAFVLLAGFAARRTRENAQNIKNATRVKKCFTLAW